MGVGRESPKTGTLGPRSEIGGAYDPRNTPLPPPACSHAEFGRSKSNGMKV